MTPVKIVVTTEMDSTTMTDVVFGDLYMCVGASNISSKKGRHKHKVSEVRGDFLDQR